MDGDQPPIDTQRSIASRILDEQGEKWARGERLPVEEFLAREPALRDEPEAVLDLIYHEFMLRRSLGESPDPVEYIRRFPALAQELIQQFAVHEAMQRRGSTTQVQGALAADSRNSNREPVPEVEGYEIEAELGRGAMGVVYRARQLRPNRLVALKFLLAGAHAGRGLSGRVRTEADAIAQLGHENIIRIYAVGEREGVPFLALEYIDGGCLSEVMGGKPRPAAECATLVATLARAIAHAHSHQIIHRDLKPSNVLLTADGSPKISDFGLAKILGDGDGTTLSGVPIGTPSYMAPEQAEGKVGEIGPAADLYALGAILYQALTGRAPFVGGSTIETLNLVVSADVVPPSRLLPKVPRDLETICLKCLEKDPRRRYAGAEALAEDLRRFLAGETILARPVGWPGRTWRWCRRNPKLAGLAATLAATFLLGTPTLLGFWLHARAEGRRAEVERDRAEKSLDRAHRVISQILIGNDIDALASEEMRPFRKALVAAGLQHSLELVKELEGNPRTESLLIDAYYAMAKMQYETGEGELAYQNYRKAIDLAERAVARDPTSTGAKLKLSVALHQIVAIDRNREESIRSARRSNEIILAAAASGQDVMPEMIGMYLQNCHNLGHMEILAKRPVEAVRDFEEGIRATEQQLKRGPLEDDILAEMARLELYLCRVYRYQSIGRPKDAIESGLRSIAKYQAISDRTPEHYGRAMSLVTAIRELALTYKDQGLIEDSIRYEEKARAALQVMARKHGSLVSRMTQVQETLAIVDYNLNLVYTSDLAHHGRQRREIVQEALGICEKLSLVKSLSAELRVVYGSSCFDLAELQAEDGEVPDLNLYFTSERQWEELGKINPSFADTRRMLVVVRLRLAEELARRGRLDEARRYDREAPAAARGFPEDLYAIAQYFGELTRDLGTYETRLTDEQRREIARRYRRDSLRILREAVDQGFRDVRRLRSDPAFAKILAEPDSQSILADLTFPADPFARN